MLTPFHGFLATADSNGGTAERIRRSAVMLRKWPAAGGPYQGRATTEVSTPAGYVEPEGRRIYRYEILPDDGGPPVVGVIGALPVDDPAAPLLPHEGTLASEDGTPGGQRRRSAADTRPIVVVTTARLPMPGPERDTTEIASGNMQHRISPLPPGSEALFADPMRGHPLVIADGHHRHAVARAHADEMGHEGPWCRIMSMVVGDGGTSLRSASFHRLFDVVTLDPAQMAARFETIPIDRPREPAGAEIVLWLGTRRGWALQARAEALASMPDGLAGSAAAVAAMLLYPTLGVGEHQARHAAGRSWVESPPPAPGAMVLLPPTSPAVMMRTALAGVRLPPKATLFWPKPLRGVIIRPIAR